MDASPDRALSVSVSHPMEGTCLVSVAGDVDIASVADLTSTVEAVTATGAARIVVDLSEVEFIDSSGLNALVVAARAAKRAGGSLVVTSPSRYVARVFELVRMDESLDVLESTEAALTRSGSPAHEAGG